jgi:hypothetical protein
MHIANPERLRHGAVSEFLQRVQLAVLRVDHDDHNGSNAGPPYD